MLKGHLWHKTLSKDFKQRYFLKLRWEFPSPQLQLSRSKPSPISFMA